MSAANAAKTGPGSTNCAAPAIASAPSTSRRDGCVRLMRVSINVVRVSGLTPALSVVLATVSLVAQTPAPQPTFRSGVTLVSTDVIPRDGNGRFVADLSKEQFHRPRRRRAADDCVVCAGAWRANVTALEAAAPRRTRRIVLPSQPRRPSTDAAGRVMLMFRRRSALRSRVHATRAPADRERWSTTSARRRIVAMVSSGPRRSRSGLPTTAS